MALLLQSRPRLRVLFWGILGGSVGAGVAAVALGVSGWVAVVGGAVLLGTSIGVIVSLEVDANRRLRRGFRKGDRILAALSELPTREQALSLARRTATDAENRWHEDIGALQLTVRQDTRQLEALLNLHAMLPVHRALPLSRGWAASPDLLLVYVGGILERRPSLVVECGSGLSTLWAALALETIGGQGKVVALEHDPAFREDTLTVLQAHGVSHRAEVRLAPISRTTIDDRPWSWYDTQALAGLSGIGILFVDGPIGALGPRSRYPALPLLRDVLAPGALILLDDADRPEEREVLADWQTDWPELTCEMLPFEKGAVRLLVPGATDVGEISVEQAPSTQSASAAFPGPRESALPG
jgi:hypothetical protein